MVFDLRVMYQVAIGQPPLVRIFGALERKLRCAQNIVIVYTFFCLPVSWDFAKNLEILEF